MISIKKLLEIFTSGSPKESTTGVVPSGGTTGQFLAKTSNTDYDLEWSASGSSIFGDIDGGHPDSVYGGTTPVDGGGP